jgi:hypothetical protein
MRLCRVDIPAILGAVLGVCSIFLYSGPGEADRPPSPFSPEYGSILHAWLGGVSIAFAALIIAALSCRGKRRVAVIVMLVVLCVFSRTPARHYLLYFLVAH